MKENEKESEQIKSDTHLGYAEEQYRRALMYLNNEGVSEEDKAIVESGKGVMPKYYWITSSLFINAAKVGHAGAQYQLGMMFYTGNRVGKNEDTAVNYFRKAAEQGHPEAKKMLETIGIDCSGKTTAEEEAEVVQQLTEAAEQGDAESQYRLALLYAGGSYGLKQDVTLAYELFRKAAEQKYEPAYNYTSDISWAYT